MKWEDFVENMTKAEYVAEHIRARQTEIECPNCGKKIFVRTDIVLATYPPKRSYFCKCGWNGVA